MNKLLLKRTFQFITVIALTGLGVLGIILTLVGMFQTKSVMGISTGSIADKVASDFTAWSNIPVESIKSHMGFVFFGGILALIASIVATVWGGMSIFKLAKGKLELGFIKFIIMAALGAFVFIFSVATVACSNDLFDPVWILNQK